SRTPEAQSLDQASRQPQNTSLYLISKEAIVKTLLSIQRLSKTNRRAISARLKRLSGKCIFSNSVEVERSSTAYRV
ncbi:MAG TPA: hypothetical protein VK487_04100, partial [Candidatus Bathyarchaeia archaeon]|nr:hypothetical protein [Candidatus Bathyarchaeia archaeon]